MIQVPPTQKPGNLFDKVSEKYRWKSDIYSKDVTRWSVYLLKTLLFSKCFSNILLTQINCLSSKQVKLMPTSYNLTLQLMSFNFTTYVYWNIYWDNFFLVLKIFSWQRVVHH